MLSIERAAMMAMLHGDEDDAAEILLDLSGPEREALAVAAHRLADLADANACAGIF